MNRDTNSASLVSYSSGNGLANPPGGIGAEFVTLVIIEFLYGSDSADIPLLNEVEE